MIYSIRDIIAIRFCYLAFRIAPKDVKKYYAEAIFGIAKGMSEER